MGCAVNTVHSHLAQGSQSRYECQKKRATKPAAHETYLCDRQFISAVVGWAVEGFTRAAAFLSQQVDGHQRVVGPDAVTQIVGQRLIRRPVGTDQEIEPGAQPGRR